MEIREINVKANMDGFGIPNPISGVLFGGEDQAHKFIVAEQNGEAFAGTVSAKFLRYADDQTVPLTGSIEDGKATVTLIENCYYLPGRFKLTIYVTANGSTTAVYCCMGTVDRTDGRTTVDPSGEINLDVTDLINQINTAVGSIPPEYTALLNTIAPNFSTLTAYKAGEYVWNGGTLYQFTADHAAGAWIGTDATAAVIGEDVSELKSAIAQSIYEYEPAWIEGRVLSDGIFDDTQATYRRTDFIDVSILSGMPIVNSNPTYSSYVYEYSSNTNPSFIAYTQIFQNATTIFTPRPTTKYVVLSMTPRFVGTDYLKFYARDAAYTLALANSDRIDSVESRTDLIITSVNLLDENGTFTPNAYIKHDGTVGTQAGWYIADQYIEVIPGKSYTVVYWDGTAWSKNSSTWYSFYTADKTPLGGAIIAASNPAVAPSNAKYLRVSFAMAVYNGGPMVGTVDNMASVTEFIPFGNAIKDYAAVNALNRIVNDINILLPEKCYAVVGSEFNIYTRNVVTINNYSDFDYYWTVSPYTMTYNLYSDCLRFTPTASNIGSYTITLYVKRHSDWKTVASKSMALEVVAKSTLTGKRVVFIGDSLTNAGYYPYEIQNVLSSGGVVSVGTCTSTVWIENVQHTITHEGRGGWSITDYVTKSSFGGATNAFWNPSTSKFDFGYWLSTNGFAVPDAVFLNLGTNGANNVDANISGLNEMIASIRQSSATVPILISLITPPATQDGWTYAVHGGSADQFAVQQMKLNARYIAEYDGRTDENIYLSPVYFNLDRYHDYNTAEFAVSARNPEIVTMQTNNVHPSYYGYLKFADVYWGMIEHLLA